MDYERPPDEWLETAYGRIASFRVDADPNIDISTVKSFGDEWTKFDSFSAEEIERIGDEYFDVVDESMLRPESYVLDLGCGAGRWSRYVAPRCRFVEAVDPSSAVIAAQAQTREVANLRVTQASAGTIPFPNGSFDFILCLGALHHIPDTAGALVAATRKLRPGGWILLYIYYALDNRSRAYRALFHISGVVRQLVSRLPGRMKRFVCDGIAVTVYLPLVFVARGTSAVLGEAAAEHVPLHYYVDKSWNVIRNDALDRFGTPLEQRFTRNEIAEMMTDCGLVDLRFSERMPCWHVVGRKAEP